MSEPQMRADYIDWEEVVKRVCEAMDHDAAKDLYPETAEEGPEQAAELLAELVDAARGTPELPGSGKSEIELETLARIINHNFGDPFLPDGHVKAEIKLDHSMMLQIGRRDVNFTAGGEILGSGTCVETNRGDGTDS